MKYLQPSQKSRYINKAEQSLSEKKANIYKKHKMKYMKKT